MVCGGVGSVAASSPRCCPNNPTLAYPFLLFAESSLASCLFRVFFFFFSYDNVLQQVKSDAIQKNVCVLFVLQYFNLRKAPVK